MNVVRLGRVVRTLRRNRRWRQIDLAGRAASSQQVVSLVECGLASRVSLRTLERVLHALEAELDLNVRWRGGQLERLLDEGHAQLVALAAARLESSGWTVRLEVTYEVGRAFGSIDVLGWQDRYRALVVGEVKAELLGAEGTLRKHDEKARLADAISGSRFGWTPKSVSRLLIVPDSTTVWRMLRRRADIFDRAYPARGPEIGTWLRAPSGALSGVWSLSDTKSVGVRTELTSRRRIRRRAQEAA